MSVLLHHWNYVRFSYFRISGDNGTSFVALSLYLMLDKEKFRQSS